MGIPPLHTVECKALCQLTRRQIGHRSTLIVLWRTAAIKSPDLDVIPDGLGWLEDCLFAKEQHLLHRTRSHWHCFTPS